MNYFYTYVQYLAWFIVRFIVKFFLNLKKEYTKEKDSKNTNFNHHVKFSHKFNIYRLDNNIHNQV